MIEVTIPGNGKLRLEHLVLDYNGTLACDGALLPGVSERLVRLAECLDIHVITADTFGTAQKALEGLPVTLRILPPVGQGHAKMAYVSQLGRNRVVAVGNGRNDRLMVQAAVLDSPKMADDEVLIHIRNLSLSSEIIGKIANNRDWTKNYSIIIGLVQNPKTPINRAISFIKQLHLRDLKLLTQDRNISPVIRNLAQNLQKQKERIK